MNKTITFRIYNTLKNNRMSARSISNRLNINYNTVRKVLGQLLAKKQLVKMGFSKTGGRTLYTVRSL